MTGPAPIGALACLAAVVLGIVAGGEAGPGTATGPILLAVLALTGAVARRSTSAGLVLVVAAAGLSGLAVMQRALDGLESSPLTGVVDTRASVGLTAALVDDPGGGRWSAEALVRARRFRVGRGRVRDAGGRRVLARASGDVASRLRVLEAGDVVTLRGWLEPLSGFDERTRWQHAVGTLHVTDLVAFSGPTSPLTRVANTIRSLVLAGTARLEPVDRGLLAGFLVGDTRGIPDNVTEQFRSAGLTHLLAVSGENVAFVLALFAPLFRRMALSGRLGGGLVVLVLFGTMTRWEPSVLRAIAMAVIALVVGYLGRPTTGLRVLVLAATVLLLADPFLVHSVGFGLSCGASLGIALFSAPLSERLRGPRWVREIYAVTLAAQAGVAPLLIPVFGSMPLVALPANLVAVPIAGPLTVWGLASGALTGMIGAAAPSIAGLAQVPTTAMIHAVRAVADVASHVPVAVDGRALAALVAVGALVAAAARAQRLATSRASRALPIARDLARIPRRITCDQRE